jgi:hypothetical protein
MKNNYFVTVCKTVFSLVLLGITSSHAQNGIIGAGFGTNDWSTTDCFSDGVSGTRIITLSANGTGNQYFRLATCWDGNWNQWGPSSTVDDLLLSDGVIVSTSEVVENSTSKAYYINVSNTAHNYVFKTRGGGNPPSNPTLLVMNIEGAIRSVTAVDRSPAAPNQFQSSTITATLDAALSTGQSAYLRYTTDGFATTTIVEMTGSGTSYTASIPAQPETTDVIYYVFTSKSGVSIAHADADLYSINLNNNGGSNYSYEVQASGLPVTLTSFNATCNTNDILLSWTTASEYNASHFDVEMSRDGLVWNNIGQVQAAGTTNQTTKYEFNASSTGALSYFRLVQVDFDGVSEIYGPISSTCDMTKNAIVLSPNPAAEAFKVEIQSLTAIENAEILIVDMLGSIVEKQSVSILKGNNQILMQHHLKSGTYLVRIASENGLFEAVRLVVK